MAPSMLLSLATLRTGELMTRRFSRGFVRTGIIALLAGVLTSLGLPAQAAVSALPNSMTSTGDSITRAFNAGSPLKDSPGLSWSTGDSSKVHSHFRRIRAQNPDIVAYNDAKSGARMGNLNDQAKLAVSHKADYVTVLMGANDACRPSEADMTPVSDFESQFRTAMATLREGLPRSAIFVASIPDLQQLLDIGENSANARQIWAAARICPSMLANPLSEEQEDIERRERVRQRVIDFNSVLEQVCEEESPYCRFDDNAVFSYPFQLRHLSTVDYFHLSIAGQNVVAELTWRKSFFSSGSTIFDDFELPLLDSVADLISHLLV